MKQTLKQALFASIQLPVKPAMAAQDAMITFHEEPAASVATPFFGGYAEDFLADLGLDVAEESPRQSRVKQV